MNTLIQYIRRNRRRPIGCVVATKAEDGTIKLGWSLCYHGKLNPETGRREGADTFSKEEATTRALARAAAGRIPWPPDHDRLKRGYWDDPHHIPPTVDKYLIALHDRAVQYFSKEKAPKLDPKQEAAAERAANREEEQELAGSILRRRRPGLVTRR